jgi:hypothetical protein
MAMQRSVYSTRSISLILLAAFAGMALWLFTPAFGRGSNGSTSGPGGGSVAGTAPASVHIDGAAEYEATDNVVTRVFVPVAVGEGAPLDLSGAIVRAETAMADTASAVVPATFRIDWRDGNGDRLLDPGEHAVLTVDLPSTSTVHPENPLRLVFRRDGGTTLVIEDVLRR